MSRAMTSKESRSLLAFALELWTLLSCQVWKRSGGGSHSSESAKANWELSSLGSSQAWSWQAGQQSLLRIKKPLKEAPNQPRTNRSGTQERKSRAGVLPYSTVDTTETEAAAKCDTALLVIAAASAQSSGRLPKHSRLWPNSASATTTHRPTPEQSTKLTIQHSTLSLWIEPISSLFSTTFASLPKVTKFQPLFAGLSRTLRSWLEKRMFFVSLIPCGKHATSLYYNTHCLSFFQSSRKKKIRENGLVNFWLASCHWQVSKMTIF